MLGVTPTEDRAALLSRARELVPLLRARAEHTERTGKLSDDVVDALRAGGFFRLAMPRRFGGLEADARTLIEVCTQLARGCGSSSWIVNIVAGASFVAARFSDQAREEIWGADPGAVVCATLTPTGTARTTEGGLLVEGSWHFASGIHHARWVIAGVQVLDQGGEAVGVELALLPVSELKVQLTWQVAGMKGTGSDSYAAAGVLVPHHRTLSMAELFAGGHASSRPEEPRYTAALSGYLALPLLGPILGLAQAALELTHERLSKGKPLSVSLYPSAAAAPSVQLAMADAASLVDTATLHALRGADDLDAAVAEARALDLVARARILMDTAVAARRAREAVDLLLTVGGASSFAEANPLQRIWRDLETASRHALASDTLNREVYGRALLGIEEPISLMA